MLYTTGINTAAETPVSAYGLTIIDDADAATARATLGRPLPRYGILGYATGVDHQCCHERQCYCD